MFGFDCVEKCAVTNIKFLIAATTCAGVENRVLRFAVKIGIARIDFAEIGEKRHDLFVALVNSAARFMNFGNFSPRKNRADVVYRQKTSADSCILLVYT